MPIAIIGIQMNLNRIKKSNNSSYKSRLIFIAVLLFQIQLCSASDSQKETLIFGLLPSESAITKFKRYAPLRDYLSKKLNRKIHLETARSFPEFIKRTKEGRYDFLETAPHFVIPAIDSKKYRVITTIVQPLSAQIVVLKSSKYSNLSQLSGLTIATPSPKAIITKIGKNSLNKVLANTPSYKSYKTHNAAYESVLGKHSDAAIISVNVFNKAIRQEKPLRSIGESNKIPNMSILVSSRISHSLEKELQTTLINMLKTDDGIRVLKEISYPGYRKATAKEFNPIRRYLK